MELPRAFPGLTFRVVGDSADQGWMVDIVCGKIFIVVEHKPPEYGVSRIDEENIFGAGHDTVFESWKDAKAQVEILLRE